MKDQRLEYILSITSNYHISTKNINWDIFGMFLTCAYNNIKKFEKVMGFILFFIMVVMVSAEIESINQIINGKFTNPGLPPENYNDAYPKSIEGWSCTEYCQLQNCLGTKSFYPRVNNKVVECTGYVMDLNSWCIN